VLAMQEEMDKLLRSTLEVIILPEVIAVAVKDTISAAVSAVQAHFNELKETVQTKCRCNRPS
jgi:hypothetical protein